MKSDAPFGISKAPGRFHGVIYATTGNEYRNEYTNLRAVADEMRLFVTPCVAARAGLTQDLR
jgi:hypothetical protein